MTDEFKSLLRNVFGAIALAGLFSYLTFVAPSNEKASESLGENEDVQSREGMDSRSSNLTSESGGSNRLPSSFEDSVDSQITKRDRSKTSVGARVSRPSSEARDPAYESRQIEGSSNGSYSPSNNIGSYSYGSPNISPSTLSRADISSTSRSSGPSSTTSTTNDELGVKTIVSNSQSSDGDEVESRTDSNSDSGSGGSTTTTPTPPATEVTCSHDQAEGTYASSISITITCSETATIRYCIDTGGSPCTPTTVYTGPIALATDGNYGVSYYGEASTSSSDVDDLLYTIDSTLPDLTVTHDVLYAQTTQVPLLNSTASNDFGTANYFYHQINFKSFNPFTAATPWTCSEVLSDYATASPTPDVIQGDYDVSGLLVTDQINQTVDMPNLAIGDNYIATVIEDRLLGVVNCQIQNVVVRDFAIADFTATGATPVSAGVRTTLGSFVGFGHFQATPNTSVSGQLINTQGTTSTKQGLYTLTH